MMMMIVELRPFPTHARSCRFCKLDHWPETAKKDVNLRQYWFVRQYLTVQQGLLLFQSRLVIPAELQEEILQRLHHGHQGVVKCRALARSCVWWPGLSKKIEEVVGTCATCEKERNFHLYSRPRPQTTMAENSYGLV